VTTPLEASSSALRLAPSPGARDSIGAADLRAKLWMPVLTAVRSAWPRAGVPSPTWWRVVR